MLTFKLKSEELSGTIKHDSPLMKKC